jgi:divalent metal cation (Fe/Co/Zn/Cd) transporter
MTAAPELAHAADTMLNSTSGVLSTVGGHAHVHALDPNAAWIALLSVLLKEWMYRATLKVAKEERSNVLEANALHHRSDVFSGCLAGVAIIGSSMGFPMLDPVGGLLVAGMIIKQGSEIGLNAMKELVDYAIDPKLTGQIEQYVLSMREDSTAVFAPDAPQDHKHDHTHEHSASTDSHLHSHEHEDTPVSDLKLPIRSVSAVRTFKSGTFTLADMAIGFPPDLTVAQASKVADQIADSIKSQFPGIKEVVVRFDAEENIHPSEGK